MKKIKFKKVVIAMSGGVDSSVSAYLLLKKGYHVEGIFMKNWEEDDNENYCHSYEDLSIVQNVCKQLGILLHKVNFSIEYWDNVFQDFIHTHYQGKTPNPDILCNKKIKFGILFNFVIKTLKMDYIATGHYARIKHFNQSPMLLKGIDKSKDQSYFLYTLNKSKLGKILFPIGNLHKVEVRQIARKINLLNSDRKDSTGICFINPKQKISNFLNRYIYSRCGNIINDLGYIIGVHNGLINYTIGQRKGIGIGGKKNGNNIPWYVIGKDLVKNTLIVAQGINNVKLFSIGLIAINTHWINKFNISNNMSCFVKTRYRQSEIPCKIVLISLKSVKVIFNYPVSSVTPGQSVVFYSFDICLGGGVINQVIPMK